MDYLKKLLQISIYPSSTVYCLLSTKKNGFTLIEVMVTVAILSLGTLLIQQGLLRSSDFLNHYNSQLAVEAWADEKIWDIREALLFAAEGSQMETSGSFTESGRNFSWSIEAVLVPGVDQLYFIKMNTTWLEGNRLASFSKAMYASTIKQTKL